jgi:hypothetical protein
MNIANLVKSFSQLELSLLVIFVLYLVLPIQTPSFLAGSVDSSIGIVTMFAITIYLFFYSNPILAIIYIFVAYELLRRSSSFTGRVAMIQYTPTQQKKDTQMTKMNPVPSDILEVDVISQMAPIGKSDPIQFLSSSYKPIVESVGTASAF